MSSVSRRAGTIKKLKVILRDKVITSLGLSNNIISPPVYMLLIARYGV